MEIAPHAQAVLLLTASLRRGAGADAVEPLTNSEWADFARWLREEGRRPEQLLTGEREGILAAWPGRAPDRARLAELLDRGAALALSLEKWLGAGLWILTRAEDRYPRRLKQRLGWSSPPVLFGCGDPGLLSAPALAVVGPRNAEAAGIEYAAEIGRRAAGEGLAVVSGGARGVDEAAMTGALEVEGTVVGVLADSLLRRSAEARWRPHLLAGNLTFVTPFHPEAAFLAGNAKGRNRYIYCLSDAAVVVGSGRAGGTFGGATENLRRGWVPVWVRHDPGAGSGTAALIEAGAHLLPEDPAEIDLASLGEAPIGGEDEDPGSGSGQMELFGQA